MPAQRPTNTGGGAGTRHRHDGADTERIRRGREGGRVPAEMRAAPEDGAPPRSNRGRPGNQGQTPEKDGSGAVPAAPPPADSRDKHRAKAGWSLLAPAVPAIGFPRFEATPTACLRQNTPPARLPGRLRARTRHATALADRLPTQSPGWRATSTGGVGAGCSRRMLQRPGSGHQACGAQCFMPAWPA